MPNPLDLPCQNFLKVVVYYAMRKHLLPIILGILSGVLIWIIEIVLFTFTNDFAFTNLEFYAAVLSWYACQGALYGLYCLISLWLIKYIRKILNRPAIDLLDNYNYALIFLLFCWLLLYLPLNRPAMELPRYLILFKRRVFFRWQAAILVSCLWLFLKKSKRGLSLAKFLLLFCALMFSIFGFVHLFRLYNEFLLPANINAVYLFAAYEILFTIYILGMAVLLLKALKVKNNILRPALLILPFVIILASNTCLLRKIYFLSDKGTKISQAPQRQADFNIIFIVLDTARAENLSVYGYKYKTTPHLEEFAKEAVVYDNCISAANSTHISHAAMFTGIYPSGCFGLFGLTEEDAYLDDKFLTLAEILSENGYQTAFIVSNYLGLGPQTNLAQGHGWIDCIKKIKYNFFLFEIIKRFERSRLLSSLIINKIDRYDSIFSGVLRYYHLPYREAEVLNRNIFKWIAKHKDEAFYLFINYLDPHPPYLAQKDFLIQSKRMEDLKRSSLKVTPDELELLEKRANAGYPFKIKLNDKQKLRFSTLYDLELMYLDFHLGKLTSFLKDNGLYDNTLIIITSDHGEAFGEHDNLAHGFSLYQEEIHVPLLIKYPESFKQKPQRIRRLIQNIDLFPTLLSLLNIDIADKIDAINLSGERKFAISESVAVHKDKRYESFSIIKDSFKIIKSHDTFEFYDLSTDYEETKDISNKNKAGFENLSQKLNDWIKTKKLLYPKLRKKDKPSQELIDQLRSLGYIN